MPGLSRAEAGLGRVLRGLLDGGRRGVSVVDGGVMLIRSLIMQSCAQILCPAGGERRVDAVGGRWKGADCLMMRFVASGSQVKTPRLTRFWEGRSPQNGLKLNVDAVGLVVAKEGSSS